MQRIKATLGNEAPHLLAHACTVLPKGQTPPSVLNGADRSGTPWF